MSTPVAADAAATGTAGPQTSPPDGSSDNSNLKDEPDAVPTVQNTDAAKEKRRAVEEFKAAMMKAAAGIDKPSGAGTKLRNPEVEAAMVFCLCVKRLAAQQQPPFEKFAENLPRLGENVLAPLLGICKAVESETACAPTSERITGRVKSYNTKKGFGFIDWPGYGRDIFVFNSHLIGRVGLLQGETVEFSLIQDDGRPQARQVRVVAGGSAVRPGTSANLGANASASQPQTASGTTMKDLALAMAAAQKDDFPTALTQSRSFQARQENAPVINAASQFASQPLGHSWQPAARHGQGQKATAVLDQYALDVQGQIMPPSHNFGAASAAAQKALQKYNMNKQSQAPPQQPQTKPSVGMQWLQGPGQYGHQQQYSGNGNVLLGHASSAGGATASNPSPVRPADGLQQALPRKDPTLGPGPPQSTGTPLELFMDPAASNLGPCGGPNNAVSSAGSGAVFTTRPSGQTPSNPPAPQALRHRAEAAAPSPVKNWRVIQSKDFMDVIVRKTQEVSSEEIRRIVPGTVVKQQGETMTLSSGLVRMPIEPDGWVTVHARNIGGPVFLEEVDENLPTMRWQKQAAPADRQQVTTRPRPDGVPSPPAPVGLHVSREQLLAARDVLLKAGRLTNNSGVQYKVLNVPHLEIGRRGGREDRNRDRDREDRNRERTRDGRGERKEDREEKHAPPPEGNNSGNQNKDCPTQ